MNYSERIKELDGILRPTESFDINKRHINVGDSPAMLYNIDGFIKDSVLEKLIEFLMSADKKIMDKLDTAEKFAERFMSYGDTELSDSTDDMMTAVLSGMTVLICEKYEKGFIIDIRDYPSRGIEEPNDDRVLRGSHDGFAETLVVNTALIRRRIRNPQLTVKAVRIGTDTKTDVALMYMDDRADKKTLEEINRIIKTIHTTSLCMAQQSFSEHIHRKCRMNPFPKVRYTERPDAAAASILEGKIAVVTDNSPSVLLLPTSLFDFVQDTNDYYFPSFVGTYLRWTRIAMFFLTIFLVPVWYLLVKNPQSLPEWLEFLAIDSPAHLPLFFQILMFEFVIDGLKLASLNTPSSLSNSFSVVGALILGQFAVESGLFCTEVILFMAFTSIGNFTQPSFELGYAFKLMRILMIILTAIFDFWGLIAGVVIMVILIATNKTLPGQSYLYPLIPFNRKAIHALLVRKKKPD